MGYILLDFKLYSKVLRIISVRTIFIRWMIYTVIDWHVGNKKWINSL